MYTQLLQSLKARILKSSVTEFWMGQQTTQDNKQNLYIQKSLKEEDGRYTLKKNSSC